MTDMTSQIADDDHRGKAVARVASAWRWDDEMERLAADRSVLDRLPAGRRTALGHYLTSKRAAEQLGGDVTDPKETK
jgi:hypothetical protein